MNACRFKAIFRLNINKQMRGEKIAQMAPANDEKRLDEIGGGELTKNGAKELPSKKNTYTTEIDSLDMRACVCVMHEYMLRLM